MTRISTLLYADLHNQVSAKHRRWDIDYKLGRDKADALSWAKSTATLFTHHDARDR